MVLGGIETKNLQTMSLNDSTLNTSAQSISESVLEESTLNHNANFSKLDISQILTEESMQQGSKTAAENGHGSAKLSITLEQEEKEILSKNNEVNGSGNSNTQKNQTQTNGSLCTTLKATNSRSTTNQEISMQIEGNGGEKVDDESVIPVEDDEDDVEEISTLESSNIETTQTEMFSHLQPNKIVVENASVMEPSHMETITELESSQCVQNESELFQYTLIEVGRRLWPSNAEKQHYTKGCFWSPDGTCLLVPVHLDGMHVVELPTDLYTMQELNVDRNLSELSSAVYVKEGGTVYDCCWYPFMNSTEPATCCWVASRQHEPIHMWDAFTGDLRCSYRGYDEVDEVESAISIVFSNDASKVIGGYKKTIKIFDADIPGRDCSSIPVKQAVSCFALTTDNAECVTAGTWMGYINHFDLRAPKQGPLFTLGGHTGGITWLKYSPTLDHNWYLFSGARKDNKILQWDMRNYTEPVQVFERNVETNQRIYYDLTPLNSWLASGDTEGLLRIWNLEDKNQKFELPLHQDCCNGVSFHPTLPIITTTSGQYHFVAVDENEGQSKERTVNYENSLLFLWYGPSKGTVSQ